MEKIKKASPNFKTVMLGKPRPHTAALKSLIYWSGVFHHEGLTPSYGKASYGNLSLRLKKNHNAFLITASGIRLKNKLKKKDFFEVIRTDAKAGTVHGFGRRVPSSETLLHDAIYKRRKNVQAIFHGHCGKILRRAATLGIPSTQKEEKYGTTRLVNAVCRVLKNRPFLVMKNHGFLSLGKTARAAGNLALKVRRRCFAKENL
jgi:ribulose-5-phosphate 4-epimerase/fuculose-1-phosphate aldolase